MKLSILDQVPVTVGNSNATAFNNAIELAKLGEALGYTRIWFAEHHGVPTHASATPEILTAYAAAMTETIRVGTGGTMIMHYSPLKIAENFKALSALAPGRIDFGAGRGVGGSRNSTLALASGQPMAYDDLYGKLATILALLQDEVPSDMLYKQVPAVPQHVALPEAWLLGSSGNSAIEAAQRGIGYSFAQFFMGELSKPIFDAYRDNFIPSSFLEKPMTNVSYLVTTAETAEEAEFEAGSNDIYRLMMDKQGVSSFVSPTEAQEIKLKLTEMDKLRIADYRKKRHLVGSAKDVAASLLKDSEFYGFDEAMILSITHSQEKRLAGYRLLAKEII